MSFVVFISGVNKGIGRGFAEAYLSRPNHTVIGSIRETAASTLAVAELRSFPAADGSRLMLVTIESRSPTDAANALKEVADSGIDHLDLVIANAGGTPVPTTPFESVEAHEMIREYQVNAVGPLMLFQACRPLLQKAASPKWISISTGGGSITLMGKIRSWDGAAYAAAKAALNWITRQVGAIHFTNEGFTAIAINPGLVGTDIGNWIAKEWNIPPTYTIEESVTGMMKVASGHNVMLIPVSNYRKIDGATREESSGKFFRMNGEEIPW